MKMRQCLKMYPTLNLTSLSSARRGHTVSNNKKIYYFFMEHPRKHFKTEVHDIFYAIYPVFKPKRSSMSCKRKDIIFCGPLDQCHKLWLVLPPPCRCCDFTIFYGNLCTLCPLYYHKHIGPTTNKDHFMSRIFDISNAGIYS